MYLSLLSACKDVFIGHPRDMSRTEFEGGIVDQGGRGLGGQGRGASAHTHGIHAFKCPSVSFALTAVTCTVEILRCAVSYECICWMLGICYVFCFCFA